MRMCQTPKIIVVHFVKCKTKSNSCNNNKQKNPQKCCLSLISPSPSAGGKHYGQLKRDQEASLDEMNNVSCDCLIGKYPCMY